MADSPAPGAPTLGGGNQIVAKAKELAVKLKDSSYKMGGKDETALDCSYFVYLVLHAVYPDYRYLNTAGIAGSPAFTEASTAQPGDVIYFPAGPVPHAVKDGDKKNYPAHVGIVLDATSWVGRQSSSLGVVFFSNRWWGSRTPSYYRYARLDAALPRANTGNLRRHFA